jgi:hypothetical protein
MAGPCSDDIAQLSRQLGGMPGLGAPVSGVAGEPVRDVHSAQMGSAGVDVSDKAQPGGASRVGGGSPGTVGGVSGAAVGAKDAVASGQVATSDQDVRNQSVGKPTAAQAAANGSSSASSASDDRVSQAKMSLQDAVDLNAKGDASCSAAVTKTRSLMAKG